MFIHVCVVCCDVVDVGRLTEYWGDVGPMKVDGMSTIFQSTNSSEDLLHHCGEVILGVVD